MGATAAGAATGSGAGDAAGGAAAVVAAAVGAAAGADPIGTAGTGGTAGRPLLAATGAVAQVPTQWSGAGGAASAEVAVATAKASSRKELATMERRRSLVTGVRQPRKKVSAAPYYAGLPETAAVDAARRLGAARLSRIVGCGRTLTVVRSTLTDEKCKYGDSDSSSQSE